MRRLTLLTIGLLIGLNGTAQSRWCIEKDGSIVWNVNAQLPHDDHIEMSGEQVSVVLRYGVQSDGSFALERSVVWPLLRTIPNNTHASLMQRFATDYASLLLVNGRTLQHESVKQLRLNGRLTVVSEYSVGKHISTVDKRPAPKVVELTRTLFPSTTLPMLCERYTLRNISGKPIVVNIPDNKLEYHTDVAKGVDGSYTLTCTMKSAGIVELKPQATCEFYVTIQGRKQGEAEIVADVAKEEQQRLTFVGEVQEKLKFNSPDETINTMFSFAKVRASESIYKTKGGYMHGPGGESYYAAIWANDQAEYVNPFFPFLGYETGNLSAFNAYLHFARFMNDEYRPIPSSIIAEGIDIWNGAGDRGDAAMIAYGASRYALTRADRGEAEQLWPLIKWCLEFCRRELTAEGVVASDSDELEGRFPSGKANLNTSCLYYDALVSASYLAKELGEATATYKKQAAQLKQAIDSYFAATVEGFDTYQYYKGNTQLRSWICTPLTMGIFERKEGTIQALFSPQMWTSNGLLSQSGSETFWDRSALYGLRGVYAAGDRETATQKLHEYSVNRLLGEHVPYAIEAWPEGSQRHLSAESGLYCRIITEGLFGIRPIGFRSFTLAPQLPKAWNEMSLSHIDAFAGEPFSINVSRIQGDMLQVRIERAGKNIKTYRCKVGDTLTCKL